MTETRISLHTATIELNTYAKLDAERDIANTIFNDSVKKAHNLYAEIKKVNNK